jgi:hypothetical protein
MAKITPIQVGDTGLVSRNKINPAIETVEVDGTKITGDGNVGTELTVDEAGLDATLIPFVSTTQFLTSPDIADAINEVGAGLAQTTLVINSESDFPIQDANTIDISSGFAYKIGSPFITSKQFLMKGGTIFSDIVDSDNPFLTYTGTGSMFLVDKVKSNIYTIGLDCPNGTLVEVVSDNSFNINHRINLSNFIVGSCLHLAKSTSGGSLVLSEGQVNVTGTYAVLHDGNVVLSSLERIAINLASAGAVGVDMGAATVIIPEYGNLIFSGDATAIPMSGLINSGNLPAGSVGTVEGCNFTGFNTPLQGISVSDVRWDFEATNASIPHTVNATDAFLVAPETVPNAGASVFTEVDGGNWLSSASSRFTVDAAGVVTYIGEIPIFVKCSGSATVEKVGGGSQTIEVRFAVNWTAGSIGVERSGSITQSTTPTSIPLEMLTQINPNDNIRMIVSISNTSNIIVDRASLVITEV